MKEVDGLMDKIRKGNDVNASAKRLATVAADIQKYWAARSDTGKASSADLLRAANALAAASGDAIPENSRLVGAACRNCHTAHRERLADGSYKIK